MNIQETIQKYKGKIARMEERRKVVVSQANLMVLESSIAKYGQFVIELEEIERKAWECSVEMMEESFRLSNEPETHALTKIKNNSKALGFKYAAYTLRETFGFPKSEAPEKFNEKKEGL